MNTLVTGREWRVGVAAAAMCGLAITLLSGPLFAPGVALAADNDEVPAEESAPPDATEDVPAQPETPQDREDDASEDTPDKPDGDESEEVFVPSEDISEDIDVPFPVDI